MLYSYFRTKLHADGVTKCGLCGNEMTSLIEKKFQGQEQKQNRLDSERI